ncbi:hypothetical protein FB451DRAFT_439469 [Mycena latifolia]|nr:hypothetical protein FB451DRAFT_439469 [Mycena latifolia]
MNLEALLCDCCRIRHPRVGVERTVLTRRQLLLNLRHLLCRPLYAITAPIAQAQVVRELMDIYRHTDWLPDFRMSLNKGFAPVNDSSDNSPNEGPDTRSAFRLLEYAKNDFGIGLITQDPGKTRFDAVDNDDSGAMGAYVVWSHLARMVFFSSWAGHLSSQSSILPKIAAHNEANGAVAAIMVFGLSAENNP